MKLLKSEHKDKGIWYFTTAYKASKYTGVSASQISQCSRGKGWTCEWIENDNIPTRFINPNEPSAEDELREEIAKLRMAIEELKNGK